QIHREEIMKFVESLRNNRVAREVLHFGDQTLRVSGLVFILMLVGVVIVLAHVAKPDQHSFHWFIRRTCPKTYGTLMQAIKLAPLPKSDLYQSLRERRSQQGASLTKEPKVQGGLMKLKNVLQLATPLVPIMAAGVAHAAGGGASPMAGVFTTVEGWLTGDIAEWLGICAIVGLGALIWF